MNVSEFKTHLERKKIKEERAQIPVKNPRVLGIKEAMEKRIMELEMMIEDAEEEIEDSNTRGFRVRFLQRNLKDMKEVKTWNEMVLEGLNALQ